MALWEKERLPAKLRERKLLNQEKKPTGENFHQPGGMREEGERFAKALAETRRTGK